MCNTQDAQENLLEIKANTLQSIAMGALAPVNFLGLLCVNLPAPKNAYSCNRQVEKHANLPMVTYDSQERRALHKAINTGNLSRVKEALASSALTSFSVNGALLRL